MKEDINNYIKVYFTNLLNHHQRIFKNHSNASLSKVNYIQENTKFFYLVNLLSQIETEFNDSFIYSCKEDIIHLDKIINSIKHDNELLEILFNNFQEEYPYYNAADYIKLSFFKVAKEVFKLHKNTLLQILNTKFYYLDKYIYDKICKSNKIRYFLDKRDLKREASVLEFFPTLIDDKLIMNIDYSSFDINLISPYKAKDIVLVKSLVNNIDKYDSNTALAQIIKGKHHIPYFNNIDDFDIQSLIKNVRFKKYEKNEVIIKEYDKEVDQYIYFLVGGECEVSLKGKRLSTIEPKTIFGEFTFITNEPRSATITTIKESIIISFEFNLDLFENAPELFSQLYKNISEELVQKFYKQNKFQFSK